MGVRLYEIKARNRKKFIKTVEDIKKERLVCIKYYNSRSFWYNRYDEQYFLLNFCQRLNNLYKIADDLLKRI